MPRSSILMSPGCRRILPGPHPRPRLSPEFLYGRHVTTRTAIYSPEFHGITPVPMPQALFAPRRQQQHVEARLGRPPTYKSVLGAVGEAKLPHVGRPAVGHHRLHVLEHALLGVDIAVLADVSVRSSKGPLLISSLFCLLLPGRMTPTPVQMGGRPFADAMGEGRGRFPALLGCEGTATAVAASMASARDFMVGMEMAFGSEWKGRPRSGPGFYRLLPRVREDPRGVLSSLSLILGTWASRLGG